MRLTEIRWIKQRGKTDATTPAGGSHCAYESSFPPGIDCLSRDTDDSASFFNTYQNDVPVAMRARSS
jgi:hypothetical protein